MAQDVFRFENGTDFMPYNIAQNVKNHPEALKAQRFGVIVKEL